MNKVRDRLNEVLETKGIKLNFIAKELGWNYNNLVSFKNGKYNYQIDRLEKLWSYLDKYK